MFKRSVFTNVTPLPSYITREVVIEALQQHSEMIELNPLVIKHEKCKPPPNAPADEFHCVWYELTDKVHYLPGGLLSGNVSYKACFHDLPKGLQTHVYAPTGLDIKEKWSVGGNMPGEPREPVELGLTNAPREGLYLREDVDMRCNMLVNGFVKKTLKKAHGVLVDRLMVKADILKGQKEQQPSTNSTLHSSPTLHSNRSSIISPTNRVEGSFQNHDSIPNQTSSPPQLTYRPQDEMHFPGFRGPSHRSQFSADTTPFPSQSTQRFHPSSYRKSISEIDGSSVVTTPVNKAYHSKTENVTKGDKYGRAQQPNPTPTYELE